MDIVTLNISLPKKLADRVDEEVNSGQYASRSEFFRTLLRLYENISGTKIAPLEFVEFKKKPLKEIEEMMVATGKYNKKFVKGVVDGLARSSLYADQGTKA